ncbi:Hypothetical predicted protein [Cloeon dipterum]|uniref:Peptidase S1 domain-containing protein n=1 Tax=Cloeon dipterum TaxID=197152 RepID=A0A8S1CWJ4_9INSE|nr:Hypothetical predicted protein [Cloeon dipterum]
MKTAVALTLVLSLAAQAVDWRQIQSNRNAIRESHAISNRIHNGKVAPLGLLPYQAAIGTFRGQRYNKCGGSLIKANKVLTAAHCCDGETNFKVVLGANNLDI